MSTPRTKVVSRSRKAVISTNNLVRSVVGADASEVGIADAGGYYTSDNVEGALQEAGAKGLQEVTDQGGTTTNDVEFSGNLENQSYYSPYLALPFAQPNVDWNIDSVTGSQTATLTLTGDTAVRLNNTVPTVDPSTIILEVKQDATGGHSMTFNSASIAEVDTTQVSTEPNSVTMYVLIQGSDLKYRGTGKTFSA